MQSSYYTPGKLFGAPAPQVNPSQPVPVPKTTVPKVPAPPKVTPVPLNLSATPSATSAQIRTPAQINADTFKPSPNPHGNLFSGNLIQKVIDAVSLPYYAIASFDKGEMNKSQEYAGKVKGTGKNAYQTYGIPKVVGDIFSSGVKNIIPGTQARTQFGTAPSDFNAGKAFGIKNPVGQEAANFGLSLAAPFLPIGKVMSTGGKIAEKIPGVATAAQKVAQGIGDFAKSTPAVYKTIETFAPYFRNPEAGKIITQGSEQGAQRIEQLRSLIQTENKGLSAAMQKRVGQVLEGGITTSPTIQAIVSKIRPVIQQVGNEAQKLGYLTPETIQKFKAGYMPHIFENSLSQFGNDVHSLTPRISGAFFKERTGAPNYIKQFAPSVFKGIGTEMKDIETGKAYKTLAEKFGKPVQEGEVAANKLINNQKIGSIFKGITLPKEIVDYINRTDAINRPTTFAGKAMDSFLNYWKAAKTIYNPAYHIRNLLSNTILANMSTGNTLASSLKDYVKAVAAYRGQGDQSIVNAAHDIGLIKRQNFYDALDGFLKDAGVGAKGGVVQTVKNIGGGINNKIRNFQQVTEETAKLGVFKSWVQKFAEKQGVNLEQALKDPGILKAARDKAEEAIFSPYRISKGERNLLGQAVPFYTFTRQAAPFTAKTLLNNPGAITKYDRAKTAIESFSSDNGVDQSQRPQQLEGLIRTPGTDQQGAQTYIDPTYVYPYGNFTDAGFDKGQFPFGLSMNPLAQEFITQTTGKDQYTGQPIGQSPIPEDALANRLQHAGRTFEPTIFSTIRDKVIPAFQGKTDYLGRTRSKVQAIIDAMGIKTQKITPATLHQKVNTPIKQDLRSVQQEINNIMNDQSITEQERTAKLLRLRQVYQNLQNP